MISLLKAALGSVTLLVAALSPAGAVTLSESPFVIDSGSADEGSPFDSFAFETANGDIGVTFLKFSTVNSIYLRSFDSRGVPKREKTLVFQGGPDNSVGETIGAGSLPLVDGSTLVGYTRRRGAAGDSWGLYAQKANRKGRPVGAELPIRTSVDTTFVGGFFRQLETGGVAVWLRRFQYSTRTGAFLVSPTGEISAEDVDITRRGSTIVSVTPYLSGFIAHYFVFKDAFGTVDSFAQVFGPDGQRVGAEHQIEDQANDRFIRFSQIVALDDGGVVVLRKTRVRKAGFEVTAEVFDRDWALKTPRTPIAGSPEDAPITGVGLPGGDFLVGVTAPDEGDGLNVLSIKRFDQTLTKQGTTARLTGISQPAIAQLLALKNGDAVLTYRWAISASGPFNLSGQILKP